MKAATQVRARLPPLLSISIHAAREGGDRYTRYCNAYSGISIHAAREGGDITVSASFETDVISIHAAREGGDYDSPVETAPAEDFNPRRP